MVVHKVSTDSTYSPQNSIVSNLYLSILNSALQIFALKKALQINFPHISLVVISLVFFLFMVPILALLDEPNPSSMATVLELI